MESQKLTAITRGLQHAAAETNSLVADQYIRILSQYFDHDEDGTLHARMVRVQLDDEHFAMVPLVSMAAPRGLALDRMRVELSIRLEGAREESDASLLARLRRRLGHGEDGEAAESGTGDNDSRSEFSVSLSPRSGEKSGSRPSDHVHIDLEFKAIDTPESVLRVIETYTNMIQPAKESYEDYEPEPEPEPDPKPAPRHPSLDRLRRR